MSDAPKVASKIDLQSKETIVLGAIGRLHIVKGFCSIIKAIKKLEEFSKANNLNKKFVFKLAGSGAYQNYLFNLAKELNVESQIEFLGWVKNKKDFFEEIDIFIMSSERETFGLVILEAMKFCKPIISTNSDGAKEILRPEIDAKIIEINPLESIDKRLEAAVLEMILDDEKTNKMVQNAFERLCEKFTYQALEKSLEEIVGRVKNF